MGGSKDRSDKEFILVKEHLASKLLALRMARGESLFTVAEGTGLSTSAISNYERGERSPDFYALYQLSNYYGVSVDIMLGRIKKV